jgi:DNA mismatch repair protein MSH4
MVGMAVINLTMGHVELVRVVNDDNYRRLTETLCRMPTWPQTFLVLKKVVDQPTKSALVVCLEKEFPGTEVVALDREHWNESEGLRMVDRFAWRTDIKAIRRNLEHNFYVSCAFSAVSSRIVIVIAAANVYGQVMAYVEEETDVIFRDNSLRIRYKQPADTMGLDRSTITFLELFQNIRNTKGKSSTLCCLLNNTLTPQGRRMVRSVLLQPSTNKDEITARHEAVEELSSNEDLFTEVRASLKRLNHIDVERSIPWVRSTCNRITFSGFLTNISLGFPEDRRTAPLVTGWSSPDTRPSPNCDAEPRRASGSGAGFKPRSHDQSLPRRHPSGSGDS